MMTEGALTRCILCIKLLLNSNKYFHFSVGNIVTQADYIHNCGACMHGNPQFLFDVIDFFCSFIQFYFTVLKSDRHFAFKYIFYYIFE